MKQKTAEEGNKKGRIHELEHGKMFTYPCCNQTVDSEANEQYLMFKNGRTKQ